MALVLVATAGDSTANTYISLAGAETIVLEYLSHITSGWSAAASDGIKNIALVQATHDIDTLRLSGDKYYTGVEDADDYQPLHFPIKDQLIIPAKVERATVLQACFLLRSGEAAQVTSDTMAGGITNRGTSRYSETLNKYNASVVCPEARRELKPWIITTIRIERG